MKGNEGSLDLVLNQLDALADIRIIAFTRSVS